MLVGRDAECRTVSALVAGARIGHGGVLVITGEAGIGKTSLLNFAAERAGGARLLRATGTESERDVGFGGLLQLLRPTEDDLARIPAPQAQALGVALALRDGVGTDRFAVGAATLSLLVRFSEDQPVGLLVDDAHLLDRPSAEAITFAVRRLLADPIFVVVTVRNEFASPLTAAGLPELRLRGVDVDAARELVRGAAPAHVTADAALRLHVLTGGNPLAILEMAPDIASLAARSPDSPALVPASLAERFVRRAAGVGGDSRRALLVAATVGGDLAVIHRACSVSGVDVTSLRAAEQDGLIHVDSDRMRLEFTHPLVRSAIYATASPAERRDLHSVVADVLPASAEDRRAWHRCHAAFGPDALVATAMDEVGVRAAQRSAYSVAAAAFEHAARLSSDNAASGRRFLSAGEAAWAAGDADRARSLLGEALVLDQSPDLRTQVLQLQGGIAARTGSLEDARDILMAAANEIVTLDPDRALVLFAEAINACFYLGDAETALAAGAHAEELLASARGVLPAAVGTMAAGMAKVLAGQPGVDQIRAAVEMLADTSESPVAAARSAWTMLGPLWLRESHTGRRLLRSAVDDLRTSAAVGSLPHLLFHIARDEATTDQWASAEADYAEGIGLARELEQTTELAISLAGLGWLEARQGREDDCVAHAQEALSICRRQRIHLGRAWAEFALGELALSLGRADEAVEKFAALASWLDEIGVRDIDLSPVPELVEALLRTGQVSDAHDAARGFYERAESKGQPWALARAQRVSGLLCADDEVDAYFADALALHARTLDLFEEARTRLVYGARLRRSRRRVDSRPPLRWALRAFVRLGARSWTAVAAGELDATGETAADDKDADRLTPQELQIALLLGRGKTTREAASALFLSPKTVEYHLRHVYTKLQVRSRSELAAWMSTRQDA